MSLDLDRATLTDAVAALAAGEVGSEELLDAQLDRVDIFNPSVNAVVAFDVDRARREARAADTARAAGEEIGPLAGIPLTLKDTYETQGLATTAGSPMLAEYVPETDADIVQGIRQAGGVVYGKTNVPLFAGDHQSYNDVYGLTRNAWDPDRTAGGSSGGAAVAVSCGFTLGEVGSDIGGSIRVPAHFNGIYGLKPSWGVVSERGHVPGPIGSLQPTDLAVVGPLGRSLDDIELMLDACLRVGSMGGVPGAELPPAGPVDAAMLRVGLWTDDPIAPVSAATVAAVEGVGAAAESLGAAVLSDVRPGIASAELHDTYGRLLFPAMSGGLPPAVLDRLRAVAADTPDDASAADPALFSARFARDSVAEHRRWLGAHEDRAQAGAAWSALFDTSSGGVDVIAMPVSQTPGFPHDTERSYADRTVDVDGQPRGYHELLFWAGLATMPLLPSVVIPTGAVDGLPIGVQLVGPRWSDRRLLAIARVIDAAVGVGFQPPTLVAGLSG